MAGCDASSKLEIHLDAIVEVWAVHEVQNDEMSSDSYQGDDLTPAGRLVRSDSAALAVPEREIHLEPVHEYG